MLHRVGKDLVSTTFLLCIYLVPHFHLLINRKQFLEGWHSPVLALQLIVGSVDYVCETFQLNFNSLPFLHLLNGLLSWLWY